MFTLSMSSSEIFVIPDLFLNLVAILFLAALLFFLSRIKIEVNLITKSIKAVRVEKKSSNDIGFIATFSKSGEAFRFFVPLEVYQCLNIGDVGTLTHKGDKFLSFARD